MRTRGCWWNAAYWRAVVRMCWFACCSCLLGKSVVVRLAQAQPAVKVTMLGLGSDSGCIRVNMGARVTWPQHRPWWEHELESSFSPEFLLTQLAGSRLDTCAKRQR